MPRFAKEEHAMEYIEAQKEYREVSREGALIQREFQSALRQVKVNELLEKTLESDNDIASKSKSMFYSSGKAFITTNKTEALKKLNDSDEKLSKDVVKMEQKLNALEKKQKGLESTMKTLVDKYAMPSIGSQ